MAGTGAAAGRALERGRGALSGCAGRLGVPILREQRRRGEHQGRVSPRGTGVEFPRRTLMPTATSPRAVDREEDLALLKSLWKEIKNGLQRGKRVIGEEIRSYPTPIPRCDAQFNHLYEQQARLARELD